MPTALIAVSALGCCSLLRCTTTASTLSIAASAYELEVFDDDFKLASLGAVLTFPLAEIEAAINVNGLAFGHVLIDHFASATKASAIDETGFVLGFTAVAIAPFEIDRQSKLADSRIGTRVGQLRVASQVAHQDDFVVTGH